MSDFKTLPGTLDAAWCLLVEGAKSSEAPANRLVLATAGQKGGAEARMIILRNTDVAAAVLRFYTDAASAKVEQLQSDPSVTLLAWDHLQRFQIRIRATARCRKGTPTEWMALSASQRRLYGGMPLPEEEPAAHPHGLTDGDPSRFLVIDAHVLEIETLQLDAELHRRAVFSHDDGFAGRWLAP